MCALCGVSLKDRKRSVDLYSLLGVESVAEVVRRGRLRWFGHLDRKSGDDWVSACRNVVVAGVRCVGRGRKTWRECVKDDMDKLGLHSEWVVFRDMWRSLISGKTSDPSWAWKKWTFFKINGDDDDDDDRADWGLRAFAVAGPSCWNVAFWIERSDSWDFCETLETMHMFRVVSFSDGARTFFKFV